MSSQIEITRKTHRYSMSLKEYMALTPYRKEKFVQELKKKAAFSDFQLMMDKLEKAGELQFVSEETIRDFFANPNKDYSVGISFVSRNGGEKLAIYSCYCCSNICTLHYDPFIEMLRKVDNLSRAEKFT